MFCNGFKESDWKLFIIEMRRSELIANILELLRERVIAPNDLKEFSDELKQTVNLLWTEADNKE